MKEHVAPEDRHLWGVFSQGKEFRDPQWKASSLLGHKECRFAKIKKQRMKRKAMRAGVAPGED